MSTRGEEGSEGSVEVRAILWVGRLRKFSRRRLQVL